MQKLNITVTTKNVFSKILFNELHDYFYNTLTHSGHLWVSDPHKTHFIEVYKQFLSGYIDKGKIEQPYIFSNHKNNSVFDNDSGIYYLTIQYKQSHCLLTTTLVYKIEFEKMVYRIDYIF